MLIAITVAETPLMYSAENTPGFQYNSHDVPAGCLRIPVVFAFRRLVAIVKMIPVGKHGSWIHFRRSRYCLLLYLLLLFSVVVIFLSFATSHLRLPNFSRVNKDTKSYILAPDGCKGPGAMGKAIAKAPLEWCRPLRYLNPPQPAVALVAFPSSGSTWLRYLLQQATGIYTGSEDDDEWRPLNNCLDASCRMNESVLVWTTHDFGDLARSRFRRAIVLVRKPGPAIISEFNTLECGNIEVVTIDRYFGQYWHMFVSTQLSLWRFTYLDWLLRFDGEMMVVRYEDLVDSLDLKHQLRPILRFLHLDHNVTDDQLSCAVSRKEDLYRRNLWFEPFDPYNDYMKSDIRSQERDISILVNQTLLLEQLRQPQEQTYSSQASDELKAD